MVKSRHVSRASKKPLTGYPGGCEGREPLNNLAVVEFVPQVCGVLSHAEMLLVGIDGENSQQHLPTLKLRSSNQPEPHGQGITWLIKHAWIYDGFSNHTKRQLESKNVPGGITSLMFWPMHQTNDQVNMQKSIHQDQTYL